MTIIRLSENTCLVLFKQDINQADFVEVKRSYDLIQKNLNDYLLDAVISYASIHLTFNIMAISGLEFTRKLKATLDQKTSENTTKEKSKVLEIPVYYGPEVALDMSIISERSGLSAQKIISLHTELTYDVYAIGFAPGFAYLGNVDDRITCPRKETPRKKIAKGSVGIANQQTAIYPAESPGGWQIIGRTPISVVDYQSEKLTPFRPSDQVKFKSIEKHEYLALGGLLE